ncbi:MAG: helix-turn-helix domain-containing protein [bacterium]
MVWSAGHIVNTTRPADFAVFTPVFGYAEHAGPATTDPWDTGAGSLALHYGSKGAGHLIIMAKSIRIQAEFNGTLLVPKGTFMASAAKPEGYTNYQDQASPAHTVAIQSRHARGMHVVATGITYLQWAAATTSCNFSWGKCPSGGGAQIEFSPTSNLYVGRESIEEANVSGGSLVFDAPDPLFAAGADHLDLGVDGVLRLPLANLSDSCNCTGTLSTQGNVTLTDIHRVDDSHMAARIGGNPSSVLVDERTVPGLLQPAQAGATAIVATGLGIMAWVAWKLLGGLLVKQPLDHPRRRLILTYVEEHPGTNFRTIAHELSIHQGNLTRHLHVLKRAGLVVEKRDGNRKRFFENHGRYDANWSTVAALGDPRNALLASTVASLGPCSQSSIADAMASHGWPRSNVRYRLAMLEARGIIACERRGREREYTRVPTPGRV